MNQVCEELQVDPMLIMASNIKHGANMATMSALNDHISDPEKNKKPKFTQTETVNYLCYCWEERTRIQCEDMKSGKAAEIGRSGDPLARQRHRFLVERKVSDSLYAKYQVREEDIAFASKFYKADQIPKLVDKQ